MLRRWRGTREHGSAAVEFVLLAGLLVLLLFAVLQVALFAYARLVVASAVTDGARYGANAGLEPADAAGRTRSALRAGLPDRIVDALDCRAATAVDRASGLDVVTVRCAGTMPMLVLPFALPLRIDVSSVAVKEGLR